MKIIIFETLSLTSWMTLKVIILNVSSTLTNTTVWFVAALSLIVDVQTYVRTDGCTDVCTDRWTFLPGLLGHLGGDDLKMPDIWQTGTRYLVHFYTECTTVTTVPTIYPSISPIF